MASPSPILDTPLLKVSRPIAACSRCRSAKIKCDGKLPACSACERAGKSSTCLGKSDEFARGKERSYVASLEAQCERLEKKVEATRRYQQGADSVKSQSPVDDIKTPPPLLAIGDPVQRKEASDIDDLVGDFGFLSVNATSRDFYGISSSTSFAGLLLTVAATKPLPRLPVAQCLPPRPHALSLIQHYFDNIYITTPFLLETKFWTSVDAVYQDGGRFAISFDHWALRMVLAIASASMSRNYNSPEHKLATSHLSAALEYAEDVLHPGSVAGIQSILLLTQYSMFDPEHFKTWHLLGMASRVVVDLGIHQEQVSDSNLDRVTLDARRRVFHCIYSLDRYISTALGRAFSFSDDSVNVPLPASTSLRITGLSSSQRSSLFLRDIEPALHIFEIRRVLSHAYHTMFFSSRKQEALPYLSTWELCATAREWYDKVSKDLPNHIAMHYRLEYLFTLILFLSPSNFCPEPSHFSRFLLFEYAVEFISQLYNVIVKSSSLRLITTYIDMERAFHVSSKLLDILHSSYHEIFHGLVPDPPPVPQGTPQPPPLLRHQQQRDSPGLALTCIYNVLSIFEYTRARWNTRDLLDKFNQKSESMKTMLEQKQGQFEQSSNVVQIETPPNPRQSVMGATPMIQEQMERQSLNYNISPEQQSHAAQYPPIQQLDGTRFHVDY